MTKSVFPADFIWGAATAGHQIEGNNDNSDIWEMENIPGTIFKEPSGIACDSYNRYAEDIAVVAEIGLNTYRFSVEWARIEPQRGEFSKEALDHYRDVLLECKKQGLKTMVTLHHFVSPLWLFKLGGWEYDQTPELFATYTRKVLNELGDHIDFICTMNEPNLPHLLEYLGVPVASSVEFRRKMPMYANLAEKLGVDAGLLATFNMCASEKSTDIKYRAHKASMAAIKELRPNIPAGWTLANTDLQSSDGADEFVAGVRKKINAAFLEMSRGDDFVGIQNYGRTLITKDGKPAPAPEGAELNSMGDEIYPAGLESVVREAADIAQIPVIVTENGLSTTDDTQRAKFLPAALSHMAKVLQDGIDLRGYVVWSLLDNYEWIFGYGPKFGIVEVDFETMERKPKPSALVIGKIARENGAGLI
jgi:beta-glucosidase